MTQLAVVDAHVGIDQVPRHAPVGHRILQVVEHHVGVVEIGLGFLGEPVAVVPLAHDAHGGVHVLVEQAAVPVGLHQVAHLRPGEADHLVEVRVQADVGADVEATGHVVHGHRRHPGDEQAVDAAAAAVRPRLEGGEEVAKEAAAVGEVVVRLRAVVRQHGVGEVVVLVDQHVQRDVAVGGVAEQLVELRGDGGRSEEALQRCLREQIGMPFQRTPELRVAVGLELPLQGLQLVVDRREVEAQDHVAVMLSRRVAADVGAGEGGVELVAPPAVVVVLQQRHPQRLAEAPGADQEDVVLPFQAPQEARLVDVQPLAQADAAEVGLAVGDVRVYRYHVHCRNPCAGHSKASGTGAQRSAAVPSCARSRRVRSPRG